MPATSPKVSFYAASRDQFVADGQKVTGGRRNFSSDWPGTFCAARHFGVSAKKNGELCAEVIGHRHGAYGVAVCAGDHHCSGGGQFRRLEGPEFKPDGRTSEFGDEHFNVDQVIVTDPAEEVAFDVNARQMVALAGFIANAERAQELDFGGFKVAEHGRVMDVAAGVCIDEADARLEAEGLTLGHTSTMSCWPVTPSCASAGKLCDNVATTMKPSRRVFLGAGAATPVLITAIQPAAQAVEPGTKATLKIVMDLIIPASDGMPSASEAGGISYLERLMQQEQAAASEIAKGLEVAEAFSQRAFKKRFDQLAKSDQIAVLKEMENTAPRAFDGLRAYVYESYYTQPAIRRLIGYELYPTDHAGPQMKPFDDSILASVRKMPKLYRDA